MAEPGPKVPGIPATPPPPVHAGQQAPQQQEQHAQPAQWGQQIIHLNWSYFKPEFSGKPEEDSEADLLHTNDWMNAHHFVEGPEVQRFCLTLLGEARLWLIIRTHKC